MSARDCCCVRAHGCWCVCALLNQYSPVPRSIAGKDATRSASTDLCRIRKSARSCWCVARGCFCVRARLLLCPRTVVVASLQYTASAASTSDCCAVFYSAICYVLWVGTGLCWFSKPGVACYDIWCISLVNLLTRDACAAREGRRRSRICSVFFSFIWIFWLNNKES